MLVYVTTDYEGQDSPDAILYDTVKYGQQHYNSVTGTWETKLVTIWESVAFRLKANPA